MSKSYRNQLVEWVYKSLLALTTEEECNQRFPGDGGDWPMVMSGNGIEAFVSSVNPVMTVSCTLPLEELVSLLGPEVMEVEGWSSLSCTGYSKLKPGDEWSGYEGYKICCKRAARDFTNQILSSVEEKINGCLNTIHAEEAIITELDEAFYLGHFGNLGLTEDVADEEE